MTAARSGRSSGQARSLTGQAWQCGCLSWTGCSMTAARLGVVAQVRASAPAARSWRRAIPRPVESRAVGHSQAMARHGRTKCPNGPARLRSTGYSRPRPAQPDSALIRRSGTPSDDDLVAHGLGADLASQGSAWARYCARTPRRAAKVTEKRRALVRKWPRNPRLWPSVDSESRPTASARGHDRRARPARLPLDADPSIEAAANACVLCCVLC